MFRVPAGRLAGLLAALRAVAPAAALMLALVAAAGATLATSDAWARVGSDGTDADEPSPFAAPDPAGNGGEDEPLPEGALEPPPLPDEAPPVASPPDTARPDDTPPAGPDERGPAGGGPGDAPAASEPGEEPPTPFGVDPNQGIRPPVADGPVDTSPLPEVHYGEAGLPEPVRKTRAAILEAARSGDIEALRAVLETSEMPPVLARGEVGDPITFLKESSGDPDGREILAILIDLLEAGWVRLNPGQPGEMYVWPYFAAIPIDRLTPQQLVELYRILTAADVDEMRAYDAWLFFKIGIGADGSWHYFMVEEP